MIMALLFMLLAMYYVIPNPLRLELSNIMSYIWLIVLPVYTIYIYYKYDKEYKAKQEMYSSKITNKRTPVELAYLMKHKIYYKCVTATLMNLIKKQIFIVEKRNNNYILIYNEGHSENLVRSETFLIHWLIKRIGNSKQVSLKTIISEYSINRNYFFVSYREWVNYAMVESVKQAFFESRSDLIHNLYSFVGIGYIFAIYNMILKNNLILILIMFACASLFTLYIFNFYKRTKPANEEYLTWKAFIETLNNSNSFDDKGSTEYLEECAIYAYTLGKIREFKNILKCKFKSQDELLKSSNLLYMVVNDDIIKIGKVIEKCIKWSVIRESVFQR